MVTGVLRWLRFQKRSRQLQLLAELQERLLLLLSFQG
jgi:hypothetical protein